MVLPSTVSASPAACAAPFAAEVLHFAKSFPGLGVVVVRPSRRSFSGWVCVCSFVSQGVAAQFVDLAATKFFGRFAYLAVRRSAGLRWRVSVPCVSPAAFIVVRPVSRPAVRVGGRRFRLV